MTLLQYWPWGGDVPTDGLYAKGEYKIDAYLHGVLVDTTDYREMPWGAPYTVTPHFSDVDLVIFKSGAMSDGTHVTVLNPIGAGITPSVPEPETYALMLAGLGITAVAARRRRSA